MLKKTTSSYLAWKMVANNYYIVTKWREEFRFCASDFTVGNLGRPWCQLETRIASNFDKLSVFRDIS